MTVLAARARRSQDAARAVPPLVRRAVRSPGVPLDATMRGRMEQRFGTRFGDVRIHADAAAATSARSVGAAAYTLGRDVVFARGRYAPREHHGTRLLAHELAHVVQQRRGAGAGAPAATGQAEHEARAAGAVVAEGGDPVVRYATTGLQRQEQEERPGRARGPRGQEPPAAAATCRRSSEPESGTGPRAAGRYRVRICVNSNELLVEELAPPHRRVFHSLVATGGEGTPTPTGRFRLGPWEKDYTTPKWGASSCTPWSERPGFNVFGPYIARFHNGYFLHGTLFPSAPSMPWINLGALIGGSHGCVRMNNVDLLSLHDGILSNPAGTQIVIEHCAGPAEATSELRATVPFRELGAPGASVGFEGQYRRFTPTLLGRRVQPFAGVTLGTEGLGLQAGATVEPLEGLGLYLEGRGALRTEWFRRVEVSGGAEVGLALTKARSLRLGISWDVWQTLGEDERRSVLAATLGFRF